MHTEILKIRITFSSFKVITSSWTLNHMFKSTFWYSFSDRGVEAFVLILCLHKDAA